VDEAEGHARAAVAASPGDPDGRDVLAYNGWNAAGVLTDTGAHDRVPACVVGYLEVAGTTSRTAYDASCLLALCVPLAERDERPPAARRKELARTYADQSMDLLRRAIQAGWSDGAWIRTDTDLDRLRERLDFKQLLAALDRAHGAAGVPESGPPPRKIKE
jgi:hypothetical protein